MRRRRFLIGAIITAAVTLSVLAVRTPFQSGPTTVTPGEIQSVAVAGPPQPATAAPAYRRLLTPGEYAALAWADLQAVPEPLRYFMRYIALEDDGFSLSPEASLSAKTTSLTINLAGRNFEIMRPVPVAGSRLLRLDLRKYAVRANDIAEWLVLWEGLGYDPRYSLILTKDNFKFSGVDEKDLKRVKVLKRVQKKTRKQLADRIEHREINHPGGEFIFPDDYKKSAGIKPAGRYNAELHFRVFGDEVIEVVEFEEKEVSALEVDELVRLNPRDLEPLLSQLQAATSSVAPVVSDRYLKARILTTIKAARNAAKQQSVFKTVYGGLYYEFRGIKLAKDVLGKDTKATDLDLYFESLGIGNIKGGLTADALFDRLRSDQRLAVFKSLITGKPRDVSSFNTPAVKEVSPWGGISGDVEDEDIDVGDRAIANLLTPRRKARESIFPRSNGLPDFALFNGDGARQDEVPETIAVNSRIPDGHTKRLQPAMGCIDCHWGEGSAGWKPLQNDVKTITELRRKRRPLPDIFDDLANNTIKDGDVIDRLHGLFKGDFSKNIRRARDDLAESVLRCTGPWPDGGDQTDIVRLAGGRLDQEYKDWWYKPVTAHQALREFGFEVPEKEAVHWLEELLPPDPLAQFRDIVLEDIFVGGLLSGLGINRSDFDLRYSFLLARAQRSPGWQKLEERCKQHAK